ncbi:LysR family transcriptional regulator [Ideonella sp. YS5]|uniref:LysR family transcriptional regulator n=1 Tax=Ideonella sp. YS5 TaxID=3453714 RepID=UPI003EE82C3C
MNAIDGLDLDGHLLQLLVAVHEEGSITRAAERLGVTQSAVSHGLDRLRALVGDPLFVKSGRGIAATEQAGPLAERARRLVEELRAFPTAAGFDPERLQRCITIAANDLQRDLLLPAWLRRVRAQAPGVTLRVIPSGAPEPALLREDACQVILTPRPPDGSDIVHKRLFDDRYGVFFDPACRRAPATESDYLAADHVTVLYEPRRVLEIDRWLAEQGVQRHIVASVPGFAGIAALLQGGPWLATLPTLLGRGVLRGLAVAPVPVATPPMPMYLVWHRRHQGDPAHRWLRQVLEAVAAELA